MNRTAKYLFAALALATATTGVGCAKHVHVHERGPRRVVVHERPVVVHERERVVVREEPTTHIHVDADNYGRHDNGRHRGHGKDKDRVHVKIDAKY